MNELESKIKSFQSNLKEFSKKYGENSYCFQDREMPPVPVMCSSGSLSLDNALSIGGIPEGRIIEIGGQESSGKSTISLFTIAEAQKKGKLCAYIDVEQAFDPHYASILGVDVKNLFVVQPDTMEETFEMLFDLISSGTMSCIIVDSTNAMIPKKMLEGDTDTAMMGKSALLMSQQLPKVVSLASSHKCTIIFISQIRSKVGVVYGSPEKIGVGESLKFYASIRIKTKRAEVEKDKEGEEGQQSVDITMDIFKNKVGIPYKKAKITLLTGKEGKFGIDVIKEVIDFGVDFGFIEKSGAWYTVGGDRFQGTKNLHVYIENNKELYDELKLKITKKLKEERKVLSIVSNNFNEAISQIKEDMEDNNEDNNDNDVDSHNDDPIEEEKPKRRSSKK